jgi:hypothetical protein
MKLEQVGPNMVEIQISDGTRILFSYSTPVACHMHGIGYFKTSRKFSVTTSRHINKWLLMHSGDTEAFLRDQDFFYDLAFSIQKIKEAK